MWFAVIGVASAQHLAFLDEDGTLFFVSCYFYDSNYIVKKNDQTLLDGCFFGMDMGAYSPQCTSASRTGNCSRGIGKRCLRWCRRSRKDIQDAIHVRGSSPPPFHGRLRRRLSGYAMRSSTCPIDNNIIRHWLTLYLLLVTKFTTKRFKLAIVFLKIDNFVKIGM